MKTFEVKITGKAKQDLAANLEWWSEHRSPVQAERWHEEILGAIRSLSKLPARCPIVQGASFERDIRCLLFGLGSGITHRIYFGMEGQSVIVFRVRHTSQLPLSTPKDL